MKEIFQERSVPYSLHCNSSFTSRQVSSVYHGTESLSFLGPKIWDLVPLEIKEPENVNIFRSRVKNVDIFTLPMQIMSHLSSACGFYILCELKKVKKTFLLLLSVLLV